jgi:hypothetical protein
MNIGMTQCRAEGGYLLPYLKGRYHGFATH